MWEALATLASGRVHALTVHDQALKLQRLLQGEESSAAVLLHTQHWVSHSLACSSWKGSQLKHIVT